jgi:hypothetical protein
MRASVVPYLLCLAAAGSLFAADTVPEEGAKRGSEKQVAPPTSRALGAADAAAAPDGIAAGAVFGLAKVSAEEKPDEDSPKRFTLHIPIKALPNAKIDLHGLVIQVLFYDVLNGKDIAQTGANVSSRWVKPPADWAGSDTEELAVEYQLPKPNPGAKEERKYYGYIVRIYYQQQLQAVTAEPEALGHRYPAPPRLPGDAGADARTTPNPSGGHAGASAPTTTDFADHARKLRESALLKMEPYVDIPTSSRFVGGRYPWRFGIVTTVFYVGASEKGKADRNASAWDSHWKENFGGVDDPDPAARNGYAPKGFVPLQNPFYVALPYNDVSGDTTKPEAALVIPWFKEAYTAPGKSVCQGRWVAIRNSAGKVCFGQWSDCGPFLTDHYQYVFGEERPKPNLNQGAGLEVSPAIRDFLGLSSTDVTDWKFVDVREVKAGPWRSKGEKKPFLLQTEKPERVISEGSAASAGPAGF